MTTITEQSTLTKRQIKKFHNSFTDNGHVYRIVAEVRYDDECGNGHNTFAITADVYDTDKRVNSREGGWVSGGCQHDLIAKYFIDLAPFIKWHLCSSDGPMHYLANTVYRASDRDCRGYAKGEVTRYEQGIRFNGVPITHRLKRQLYEFIRERKANGGEFQICSFIHERDPKTFSPNYSLVGFGECWHECPFHGKTEAEEFCAALNTCEIEFWRIPVEWSEGKPRDFAAARNSAIWPEATDEELSLPPEELKAKLQARLPQLLAEFRRDVESLGFTW